MRLQTPRSEVEDHESIVIKNAGARGSQMRRDLAIIAQPPEGWPRNHGEADTLLPQSIELGTRVAPIFGRTLVFTISLRKEHGLRAVHDRRSKLSLVDPEKALTGWHPG